jgi:MFS family permease
VSQVLAPPAEAAGPPPRAGAPAQAAAAAGRVQHPWLAALAVLAGTFMVVLDTTVVNVSLPHIAGSLSASVEESTWALTSYLAANAIILPMTAWLAKMVGRKRLLILAVAGFTAASACCGMAPNLPMLIVFRVIQGTTGGVMQPLSQAVMLEAFPPRDRGKAMGLWSVGIIVREILARQPVVDLRAFRERTFSVGVFLITVMSFVLFGSLVVLPVFLQVLLGYPAYQAGIALMPRGYASLLVTPLVGLVVGRVDPRKLLALGFLAGAASLLWFSRLNLQVGYWDLFWPQFLQGVSFSLLMVPLTVLTMDRIAGEAIGNAASLFNLMRNVGGSFGIAVTETLLANFRQEQLTALGRHVSLYDPATRLALERLRQAFVAGGSDPPTAERLAHAGLWQMLQRQAAMLSYLQYFRLLTILLLLAIPLVLLLKRPVHQTRAAPAAE